MKTTMNSIDEMDIQKFKEYLVGIGRQPSTVESYGRDSVAFLAFVEKSGISIGDISTNTLVEFQEVLRSKGIRSNSLRRTVIGVRQFYRFLQDSRQWDQNPFDETVIPDREDQFQSRLDQTTISKLFASVLAEPANLKSLRDRCLLHLLAYEGLKVTELIELRWQNFLYASDGGRLKIEGPRSRTIHIERSTTTALMEYRNNFRDKVKQMRDFQLSERILLGFKGTDSKHWETAITRHGVKFALYELGNNIGLKKLNCEELRHFAISHKVELGASPDSLMNHFGLRTLGNISKHLRIESDSINKLGLQTAVDGAKRKKGKATKKNRRR